MLVYILGFVITWIPYATVSLYSAFIDADAITPFDSLWPAIFAKSSMLWSTLLYIFTNKSIKSKINKKLVSLYKDKSQNM